MNRSSTARALGVPCEHGLRRKWYGAFEHRGSLRFRRLRCGRPPSDLGERRSLSAARAAVMSALTSGGVNMRLRSAGLRCPHGPSGAHRLGPGRSIAARRQRRRAGSSMTSARDCQRGPGSGPRRMARGRCATVRAGTDFERRLVSRPGAQTVAGVPGRSTRGRVWRHHSPDHDRPSRRHATGPRRRESGGARRRARALRADAARSAVSRVTGGIRCETGDVRCSQSATAPSA